MVAKIRDAVVAFTADDADGLPIVSERQFNRLSSYLGTGGDVVTGGGTNPARLTMQPTVVVDPPLDAPVMTEEIFGPILPVITVDSLDHAIEFVNARPKPLAAYLFTKAKAVRERFIREVPAGGMLVNHLIFQVSTARLPFGGVGPSGMGHYHGHQGFLTFSKQKPVLYQARFSSLKMMRPLTGARPAVRRGGRPGGGRGCVAAARAVPAPGPGPRRGGRSSRPGGPVPEDPGPRRR